MNGSDSKISVLVLEDEPDVRERICRELTEASLQIGWQGSLGAEALEAVERINADVALIDLGLPDMCGTSLIRALRTKRPELNIVVLTIFDDGPTVLTALRAGALGYLTKNSSSTFLVDSVRAAARGEAPMSPRVARFLLESWTQTPPAQLLDALTLREQEVLRLLAEGRTYAQAGQNMGIGLGTIQSHVKSIYSKLGVNSRAEAATIARRRGLLA